MNAPTFDLAEPAGTTSGAARATKRRPVQHEHTFQAWADRFIDRAVLPPMFTTGIDHAHTDMAHIGRRAAMQGRGIKFGIPDLFVSQGGRSLWIELKRGAVVTQTQAAIHDAMRAAGQRVYVARTMHEVLAALRDAGLALHGNADALAAEYEARVTAKESAPAVVRKASRTAKPRYTGRGITTAMLVGR